MRLLRRPEIRLDNYEEVYRYYRDHRQPAIAELGYRAMSTFMNPTVTYEEGAEDEIHDHILSGGQVVIAPNHLLNTDQYNIAALAASERVLHPLKRHTFVLARPDILSKNMAQRIGVDAMGAIPAWREKDDKDKTEEARQLRSAATAMLLETCVYRIVEHGDHAALFKEGTRNNGDVSRLLPFRNGGGNIVYEARRQGANVRTLPVAQRYRVVDGKAKKRRADIRIGRLVDMPPQTRDEVPAYTARTQADVQRLLDQIYEMDTAA